MNMMAIEVNGMEAIEMGEGCFQFVVGWIWLMVLLRGWVNSREEWLDETIWDGLALTYRHVKNDSIFWQHFITYLKVILQRGRHLYFI